jgi:hypothetical protein
MSFTVLRRSIIAVSIALLSLPSLSAGRDSGTAVVARLYKDFAWQAFVSIDSNKEANAVFGKDLADQPRSVLEQYFDQTLSSLIARDADCAAKTREICKLDFDPIFASQDPSAADLVITSLKRDKVRVEYTHPSSQEKIRLDYQVAKIAGQWRITDITYPSLGGPSLRSLLGGKPVRRK